MYTDPSNNRSFTTFRKNDVLQSSHEPSCWMESSIQRRGSSTLVHGGGSISTMAYLLIERLLFLERYNGNFLSVHRQGKTFSEQKKKPQPSTNCR